MNKQLGKDTDEFKFFGDLWKFYQAYYIPEESDEWWNSFINDAELMAKKYKNVKCVREILMAISNSHEDELKKESKR